VAAAVIVTAVLTPFLTSWWFKHVKRQRAAQADLPVRLAPAAGAELLEPIEPIEPTIR
jgi:hypothetical protein